jgi:hypothetical protein
MKYLEDVVTASLDAPFSEYEKFLDEIKDVDAVNRYRLVRKFGFAIQSYEEAFGDNSKYSLGFNELWGKFAALAKNLIDMRNVVSDLDFNSANREIMKAHLALVKELFRRCADNYRNEYEVHTHKLADFKIAISFLTTLRRVHVLVGERDDADTMKRKIDVWNSKLETDYKKREGQKG